MMLLSVRGTAGAASAEAGLETWSFGTKWMPTDGTDDTPQNVMDNLVGHCWEQAVSMFQSGDVGIQTNVWLTECRLYLYNNSYEVGPGSGPFRLGPAKRIAYSANTNTPVQGNATDRNPLQIATAITLSSGNRSKPRFGRFYLPPRGVMTGVDGRWGSGIQANLLTGIGTFLEGVNDHFSQDTSQDWELSIVSQTGPVFQGDLRYNPVREIRAGLVPDTQRRRRNQLDEAYITAAYP